MGYFEQTRIMLTCSRKGCDELNTVTGDNHDDCTRQLFDIGWRLSHGKQVCPQHAAQAAKRLERKR